VILVVEDDRALNELICMLLEGAGYSVLRAADNRDAVGISLREGAVIDLVISDLHLPSIEPAAIYCELQRAASPPRMLVCSGDLDEETEEQLRAVGITEFISKPFGCAQMLGKVDQMLHSVGTN
jgi:DNA-binding response OmpR family regulator